MVEEKQNLRQSDLFGNVEKKTIFDVASRKWNFLNNVKEFEVKSPVVVEQREIKTKYGLREVFVLDSEPTMALYKNQLNGLYDLFAMHLPSFPVRVSYMGKEGEGFDTKHIFKYLPEKWNK